MRLPGRVTYCLLGAIVLATVLFRYPIGFDHELGSDTTFIHSLTGSLIADGRAAWILHPASYFGLYALSYPSAMPFSFGSLSLAADLPIEGALLFAGFVFAIAGVFSAFAASRSARDDDALALIVALLFTLAPFYLKDTTWVGSSRGFVTALVPAVFVLLFRHLKSGDIRYLLLTLVLVVVMSTIHRMGILAVFLLIAYAFAIPLHRITQKLRFSLYKYESPFRWISTGTALSGFFVLFYVQFLFPGIAGADIVEQYGSGLFFDGTSFPILLANMVTSLVGKVGLLLPLVVVGLARFAWTRPKEGRDKFLLVAIFVMVPLLSLRDYIAEFLIFVFVLLVPLAIFPGRHPVPKRKLATTAIVVLLLVSSVAFSWVMKDYWRTRYYTDGSTSGELYSTSVYASWETTGTITVNEGLSAGRVAAITSRPTLPIGGASIHWFGPQQLTFRFVNGTRVSVQQIPLTTISFNTDEIYVPVGVPNAKDDYETIFYHRLTDRDAQRTLDRYDTHYVVLYAEERNEFQSYVWRPSPFVVDVRTQTYKVLDMPSFSIWYVR